MAIVATSTFAEALALELDARGITQATLAEGVGVRQNTVSRWVSPDGFAPDPQRVFEVERFLGVPPGALSVYLGYVPPSANSRKPMTTVMMLASDPDLTSAAREIMLGVYASLVSKNLVLRK